MCVFMKNSGYLCRVWRSLERRSFRILFQASWDGDLHPGSGIKTAAQISPAAAKKRTNGRECMAGFMESGGRRRGNRERGAAIIPSLLTGSGVRPPTGLLGDGRRGGGGRRRRSMAGEN